MAERTLFLRWNDHHATFMHMLPEIRIKVRKTFVYISDVVGLRIYVKK